MTETQLTIIHKALNDAFVAGKSKQSFKSFKKEWIKINKITVEKNVRYRFSCRLDEQQCSETCHGSRENKKNCSYCTVKIISIKPKK